MTQCAYHLQGWYRPDVRQIVATASKLRNCLQLVRRWCNDNNRVKPRVIPLAALNYSCFFISAMNSSSLQTDVRHSLKKYTFHCTFGSIHLDGLQKLKFCLAQKSVPCDYRPVHALVTE